MASRTALWEGERFCGGYAVTGAGVPNQPASFDHSICAVPIQCTAFSFSADSFGDSRRRGYNHNMHELGIVQGMLKVALDQAAEHQAKQITAFHIEMSALADESEDSLRFYFETLTPGTPAEGACVEIVRAPSLCKCLNCGNEFKIENALDLNCPKCGSPQVRLPSQEEFRLVSIDVE